MPLFALPLQVKVTADGLGVWVLGGDGQILLGLMHPGPDGLARLKQIVEMANRADAGMGQSGGRTCATCKWWERESQEYDLRTGPGLWWGSCHVTSERMEVDGDPDCWVEFTTREDFGCVEWAAPRRAEGGNGDER